MNNKIKVFFVIPTLFAGGAERVMSFISQNLNKDKFDVLLIVIGYEKDSRYPISGINVRYLNKKRVLHSIFDIILTLNKHKPNVVISAISHLNSFMGFISVLFPKITFVGRHTIVSIEDKKFLSEKNKSLKRKIRNKIRKPLGYGYKLLDIILCQSKDMYNDMKYNSKISVDKLRIINNPITDNFQLKPKKNRANNTIKFITVARISKNKGHKRILNAISKLDFKYQYTIIGDGVEKENILNLAEKLGIRDKITHIPFTKEVPLHLSRSDIYLMGSYSEGLPNGLIESCSVGTPVIAFRAPGGLNEVIEDGVNGFLVDSENEFIIKTQEALSKDWNREMVRDSVFKKYNKAKIINDYENMLLEISN